MGTKGEKFVYFFGGDRTEGDGNMKDLLGGKGANLAEMARIGLPVPPGFTITTEACALYYENNQKVPKIVDDQMFEAMKVLEKVTGKKFGDPSNPLLVSVRSGAKMSMPGMMDTILNLGLNDETVVGLARKTKNERFAWDCYRRFIMMFGDVVKGVDKHLCESELKKLKTEKGYKDDTELTADDWKYLANLFKKIYREHTGSEFPQDPNAQLIEARDAVFRSWMNPRAITYRKLHRITEQDCRGTAVNVQMMVFGNMGNSSATGVAFTRNPSTGEKEYFGEYLINAQGEDVVAGVRTGKQISKTLEKDMPKVFNELKKVYRILEEHYHDMQDFEFTVEEGTLYMLQTRNGKRTARAAVKIAVDMVKEGLMTKEKALLSIDPNQLDQLLHPQFDPKAKYTVLTKGTVGTPGAGVGQVVFNADEAVKWAEQGKQVILVREETCPDDIHGMAVAQGIVTHVGGATAHAIVVGRQMGKACVCGCNELHIDYNSETFTVGGTVVKKGDWISIDGGKVEVVLGKVPLVIPEHDQYYETIMKWADEIRDMNVRANADTPQDATKARNFGAKGIGLCRTEHMFFNPERIEHVQNMILATEKYNDPNPAVREEARKKLKAALDKLLPYQKNDFYGILKAMEGYGVTIRLLDPPLHEFLPSKEKIMAEIAALPLSEENLPTIKKKIELLETVKALHEVNPMLGHRGCRLALTYPEIAEMQIRAILEATAELVNEGVDARPEIMMPVVATVNEYIPLDRMTRRIAEEVQKKYNCQFNYMVGTMIELPRACTTADEIAAHAEFFSFGTNDLTQTTYGFSRDDAERKFIGSYIDQQILSVNPFEVLDRQGVGKLVKMACELGRSVRPNLKLGICGEHGGEPKSVEFCYEVGLDYVSCSPKRVPIARLAAAQATIKHGSRGRKTDYHADAKSETKKESPKSKKAGR